MAGLSRRAFFARTGAVSVAAACAAAAGAPGPAGAAEPSASDLQTLIGEERQRILETLQKSDIPGAAVCLVQDGEPVWIEGFGVTSPAAGHKVGPGTIFSIQSTSKHVTATTIMLAVQRGRELSSNSIFRA